MFSGALDLDPLPGDPRVPPRVSPFASPLRLRLLTPLLSQVGAQHQAFRLFFFFFFWCTLARRLGFCIAFDLDFLLIYQDSSINFFAPFPVSSI